MKNLETKKQIREEYVNRRREIPLNLRRKKTESIREKVTAHPWFQEASCILCYVDFDAEAGTRGIIEEAWRQGKKVAVPRIAGGNMDFYEITDFDILVPGTFGVPEPPGGKIWDPEEGLVIMPGVAFDRDRHRIGYGKGYYDRYLCKRPQLKTMAAAFDIQVAKRIPYEEHDIRPAILVTETEIIE